jgi:hypothetical protein
VHECAVAVPLWRLGTIEQRKKGLAIALRVSLSAGWFPRRYLVHDDFH